MRKYDVVNTTQGYMIKRADRPGYVIRCRDEKLAHEVVDALAAWDLLHDDGFLAHLAIKIHGGIADRSWARTDDAVEWVKTTLKNVANEYIKQEG